MNSPVSTVARALRHWHGLIWLAALVGAGLALAATLVRPPVYEATALLSIDESQSATQGFDVAMQADQFLAQRFIALGTSRDVLQAVCQREGPDCDPARLARQVRLSTPRTTAQLQVVADAPSPDAAARLANETADALIARNRQLVEDQLAGQRDLLQGQLKTASDQISQALQQSTAAEAGGRANTAGLAQLSFLQTQYAATYQRLQDLDVQIAQRGNVLTVQQRATPSPRPVDPDPIRYLAAGVGAGLVAGLLAALVAERLRKRIHHASELGEAVGTDVVADLSGRRAGRTGEYRFLARLGRARDERPRAMLLVASTERDPVNEVAMELAEVVAASHERVLVVPARAPDASGREGARPAAVLVADGNGDGPTGALGRPDDEIDVAIHCSLPPMRDATVERLRPAPDRAIVVATRGRTRFDEARRTAGLLRAVGVEIAAAILLPARMPARP
ncbi:MAG TPA: Wzz/FepE/Etk N-terminal domain-containing protein, partial [Candidatus Dormibacteraeota bacterium]